MDRIDVAGQRLIFVNRFFHPDISATSQMASGLLFGLAARGHSVHVITSRQRHDAPSAGLPRRETVDGVTIHRIGGSRFGRGGLAGRAIDYVTFHAGAMLKVVMLARTGSTVVACTDPPLLSISIGAATVLRRAVLVTWLHDLFPEAATALGVGRERSILMRSLRALRNLSLRVARLNVVLGDRMARQLTASGVPADRIAVVPNFACGRTIRPIPPRSGALREEWGLGERFVVGYSGNLGRAHEFDTMLAAAKELRDDKDVAFLFVGAGHRRKALEAEVRAHGLSNVLFCPLQPGERLAISLGTPDVHLVSLRPALEGLIVPSKIYGILAAGRPALFIGAPDGELARLLDEHQCGWQVDVGDGPGLARHIRTLRDRPEVHDAMGRAARTAFEQHYDRSIAVARWHTVLMMTRQAPSATPITVEGGAQ